MSRGGEHGELASSPTAIAVDGIRTVGNQLELAGRLGEVTKPLPASIFARNLRRLYSCQIFAYGNGLSLQFNWFEFKKREHAFAKEVIPAIGRLLIIRQNRIRRETHLLQPIACLRNHLA